jgi:hypothetical protein
VFAWFQSKFTLRQMQAIGLGNKFPNLYQFSLTLSSLCIETRIAGVNPSEILDAPASTSPPIYSYRSILNFGSPPEHYYLPFPK